MRILIYHIISFSKYFWKWTRYRLADHNCSAGRLNSNSIDLKSALSCRVEHHGVYVLYKWMCRTCIYALNSEIYIHSMIDNDMTIHSVMLNSLILIHVIWIYDFILQNRNSILHPFQRVKKNSHWRNVCSDVYRSKKI